MPANRVNGNGNRARSGAQTLSLLAAPLNVAVIRALRHGTRRQAELLSFAGSPAPSTLRAQLKRLVAAGVIRTQRRNRFPGLLEYELSEAGRDLIAVIEVVERWLALAPESPLTLGDNEAKATIKALADGWSATIVRAIAAGPRTLTELDRIISSLNYPALERRLSAMRLARLLAVHAGNGRGTPYTVTKWLRRGIGPLLSASRWEQRHPHEATVPVGRLDAEAALLLAVPLLRLPPAFNGSCRMAVEIPGPEGKRLAGAFITVADGAVASCVTHLGGDADAWALGPTGAWLAAIIDRDIDGLELGGDHELASSLLRHLNRAIFDSRESAKQA